MRLARLHRVFADPTRLRILRVLQAGPLCVCHFQTVLREPQVKISKHLATLRAAGLVEAKRSGKWMCYSLPAKSDAARVALLSALAECADGESIFRKDAGRLARLDLGCTPAASARSCSARDCCC